MSDADKAYDGRMKRLARAEWNAAILICAATLATPCVFIFVALTQYDSPPGCWLPRFSVLSGALIAGGVFVTAFAILLGLAHRDKDRWG